MVYLVAFAYLRWMTKLTNLTKEDKKL